MIRIENTVLPVVALTHPGMKGKNNEDRYGVTAFRMAGQPQVQVLLAVLSDGIGGHRAGEVASEIAVEVISQTAANSDGKNPPVILEEAIHLASQRINEQAQSNIEQQGMGATCACVWIAGDHLYTATVGDSRIYLIRGGQINQVSVDHTWVQEALDRGLIQPDQVEGHPNAHVIRRYLGSPNLPEVDFRLQLKNNETAAQSLSNQGLRLLPGDRVILCSDGLTDLVKDEEILGAYLNMQQEAAGHYLIDLANQRGGHDNITLICIEEPEPAVEVTSQVAVAARPRSTLVRTLAIGCLAVLVLGVLAGGLMGGWFLSLLPPVQTPTPTLTATLPLQATLPAGVPVKPSITPSLLLTPVPVTTPTPRATASPTVTPWTIFTPTLPLPVVTVQQ